MEQSIALTVLSSAMQSIEAWPGQICVPTNKKLIYAWYSFGR